MVASGIPSRARVIDSHVDTATRDYWSNRERQLNLLAELNRKLESVQTGGSPEAGIGTAGN